MATIKPSYNTVYINMFRLRQNGHNFAGDIQISLKYVRKGPIYNKPWFQIMAWLWTGDKQLSKC